MFAVRSNWINTYIYIYIIIYIYIYIWFTVDSIFFPEYLGNSGRLALLRFAAPLAAVSVCGPILSTIDTSFVGRCAGTLELAALGPACTVTDLIYLICSSWAGCYIGFGWAKKIFLLQKLTDVGDSLMFWSCEVWGCQIRLAFSGEQSNFSRLPIDVCWCFWDDSYRGSAADEVLCPLQQSISTPKTVMRSSWIAKCRRHFFFAQLSIQIGICRCLLFCLMSLMTNFFVSQSGMNPPTMQDMFPAVDLFVFWPVDGGDFCSGPSGRGYHHG
jgi:hypothetical protein